MKKLLLFLASGSIAVSAVAQYRAIDLGGQHVEHLGRLRDLPTKKSSNTAAKTTAAPTRWYSYSNYIDAMLDATTGQGVALTTMTMWSHDTVHSVTYSDGTTAHMTFFSTGTIFDPSSALSFNNPDYYEGEMKIGATDAYRIDSIEILGLYRRNPTSTTIVDTIRLSFLKGNGAASSSEDIYSGYSLVGGHYPGATFLNMDHDSLLNIAMSATGSPGVVGSGSYIQDILLTDASMGDTTSTGIWVGKVALTTPLMVSANQMVGMGISFMTGESTPAETVVQNFVTNTVTQGIWRPIIAYASDLATPDNALWPYYNVADSNMGYFKRMPAGGWPAVYVPALAWSTSSGTAPSTLQYPAVSFFVNCATCGNVPPPIPGSVANTSVAAKISAYPNPSNDELHVQFNLATTKNVTVTLSNVLGQVVSTQEMGNVAAGTAKFNTTTLPAGVYTYSVLANGQRSTGRVAIAH